MRLDEGRPVETLGETGVEVGGVGLEAGAGVRGGSVDEPDCDRGEPEQPLGGGEGLGQLPALGRRQPAEQPLGEAVGPPVLLLHLDAPGRGQLRDPQPGVLRMHGDPYQPLRLQRLRHPAQVPGVQTESAAQLAQRDPVPDLVQQPGLTEWPVLAEVVVVEYADAAGEVAVEAAKGGHLLCGHRLWWLWQI
ncbi:hypothetical protein GCM10010094_30750 [Streptomyces flaveus]|uniref:Uncharacterized protein n=1 Tax=Streptomyces flaveus TaxID=66370 RepID=A0A917VDP5_9ACTN|nr:hypothetical protein GCM10010094_30750 [Streptomyces flaveus]